MLVIPCATENDFCILDVKDFGGVGAMIAAAVFCHRPCLASPSLTALSTRCPAWMKEPAFVPKWRDKRSYLSAGSSVALIALSWTLTAVPTMRVILHK